MTAEAATPTTAADLGSGLGRYYAYRLVSSVALTQAVWVIFLRERGLSLGEIGVAEAAYHLAPITLELPTGSFADVFGRKWSLAVGGVLGAAAAGLMLVVDSVWLAIPALYLSGAAATFQSGAGEAFLYDGLAERDGAGGFARVFGRLGSLSYLVVGATTWFGAWLAGYDFAWPYGLAVLAGLAGAGLAAGLREPARERVAHRGIGRHIRDAVRVVRARPGLAALLGFGAAFWTLVAVLEIYAQAVLTEAGFSTAAVGLLVGGSYLPVAAGMWVAHRVTARGHFRVWAIGSMLLVVTAGLGMGSGVLWVIVLTYVVAELATGVFEPLLADRTNRDVAAPQRATILSLNGFLFSVTMVWAFPLVGWVAGWGGWLAAFGLAGGLAVLATGVWVVVEGRGK